jgi:hypothetical protein
MITVPLHTSHALQPLDLSDFKPFKTTFRKVKDATMSRSNHMEPDKITLIEMGRLGHKTIIHKTKHQV